MSTENLGLVIYLLCLVGQVRVIISCLISFVSVVDCEFKWDTAYKISTLPFRIESRQRQCEMVQHIVGATPGVVKSPYFFHKSKYKRNLSLRGITFNPENFSTNMDQKKHYRISISHGTDASQLPTVVMLRNVFLV